jgi:YafQ family addiction module toxin component
MYKQKFSRKIQKKLSKIKGKEIKNIFNKIDEILNCKEINHYKNLKYGLKNLKRVHINTHFVLVFSFEKEENCVIFEDYKHHDKIYKKK